MTEHRQGTIDDGGCGDPEPEVDGTNRTGTCVAKVRLYKSIPELVLIEGRRILTFTELYNVFLTTTQ